MPKAIGWTLFLFFIVIPVFVGVFYPMMKNAGKQAPPVAAPVEVPDLEVYREPEPKNFRIITSRDELSGEVSKYAIGYSEKPLKGWLNATQKVVLGFDCSDSDIYLRADDIKFHVDEYYDGVRYHYSRARFDDGEVRPIEFGIWADHLNGMTMRNHGEKKWRRSEFAAAMKASNRLYLEVQAFNMVSAQVMEFDLGGFTAAVAQCN